MQTVNFPPQIQQLLPELLQLNSEQRLSLINLLSTESANKVALQQAIQEGLDSPLVEEFNFETYLAKLQAEASNG